MGHPVKDAEARAGAAIGRMEQAVSHGQTFAFAAEECVNILGLIDALRDNQALATGPNPVEVPCPVCRGADTGDDDDPCDTCDGLKFVPTPMGRRILDMVERHFLTAIEPGDFDTLIVPDNRSESGP
jgi:hypothetical protein